MTEITGYPNYLIYENGDVWSKKRKIFLKGDKSKKNYIRVELYNNNKSKRYLVHRLVAIQFIPNPENKPEVDHINNNPSDNSLENLQWLTIQENLDRRNIISNTGEKYIHLNKWNGDDYYNVCKKKYFNRYLNCKKYTIEDAIDCRDYLLAMDAVVEDTE